MLHAIKLLTPKLLLLSTCTAAMLALAGCGHSDKAGDAASADNVEMPAEDTMSGLPASAVPQADPSATATGQPAGADASASAADSAAEAASGPAPDKVAPDKVAPDKAAPATPSAASPAAPIQM